MHQKMDVLQLCYSFVPQGYHSLVICKRPRAACGILLFFFLELFYDLGIAQKSSLLKACMERLLCLSANLSDEIQNDWTRHTVVLVLVVVPTMLLGLGLC